MLCGLSDFDKINADFSKTNWLDLVNCPVESFPSIFRKKVFSILLSHSKSTGYNSVQCIKTPFQRKLGIINRKIRKHRKSLYSSNNQIQKESVGRKISLLTVQKKFHF